MDEFHTPVLLQEVIKGLQIGVGKKYIDATVGGGGHGLEIVKQGGIVLGIDQDQEAINYVESRIKNKQSLPFSEEKRQELGIELGKDLVLVRGNFRDIGRIAKANGFEKVAGILFDLGVSLRQLQTPERGFSLQKDGPLDMRMDTSAGLGALDLVNGLYKDEIAQLFKKFGEERNAWRVADAICRAREIKRIETTGQLVKIVQAAIPRRGKLPARHARRGFTGRHPATKVFQALRIAVNDELGSLETGLSQAATLLEEGGRLAVISFHSLEDRIVKRFFKQQGERQEGHVITKKPITAQAAEIKANPKSRSAKLRVYEKN